MNKLLTPEEIAEFLGVKKSTIYHWTHQEYIPYVKLGNFVRFEMEAIEDWIRKRSKAGRGTQNVDIRNLGL